MNYSYYAKLGLRNATGVLVYVFCIVWLLNHAQAVFGAQPAEALIGVTMLLLFVVSALVTGSLVLWQPVRLFMDNKKSEAGALLFATGASLAVFLVLLGIILVVIR